MPDYLFLMESRLSPDQWQAVQRMQQAARSLGMNLYLVGGAVRDLIGGFPIEDLDFVAEGKALKLVRVLSHGPARVLWQNEKFQEAEMEFPGGVLASLGMARSETYTKPMGPPAVAPAPILDDLKRRDFSVSAICISLNPHSLGLLLDPTNGLADIEKKQIRTLRNSSFLEDPVRLFRAVRLRTRLGFSWDPKTATQFQSAVEGEVWEKVSGEALARELRQLAREREPGAVLKEMEKEGLLTALSPRLRTKGLDWALFERAGKARQVLDESGFPVGSFPLLLHLLTRRLSPKERTQLTKRLNLKRPELQAWRRLEEDTKHLAKDLVGKAAETPARLYQRLVTIPPEQIQLLLVESSARKVHSRIKTFLHRYLPLRSNLPVQELQKLGVAPEDPRHQKILEIYFHAQLDGKLRTHAEQVKFLKKMVQERK